MHWRRVAPVQDVGAQIVTGTDAVEQVRARLAAKSMLFSELQIDHGDDWVALFAVPFVDESGGTDAILPDLGATPLYEGYRSVLGHRLDGKGTVVVLNNTGYSQKTMDELAETALCVQVRQA